MAGWDARNRKRMRPKKSELHELPYTVIVKLLDSPQLFSCYCLSSTNCCCNSLIFLLLVVGCPTRRRSWRWREPGASWVASCARTTAWSRTWRRWTRRLGSSSRTGYPSRMSLQTGRKVRVLSIKQQQWDELQQQQSIELQFGLENFSKILRTSVGVRNIL